MDRKTRPGHHIAMTVSIVLTLIGRDRPGLVKAVSDAVAARGGNWLESRLARLAGEFAGIVLVSLPRAQLEALRADLRALEAIGLRVGVEPTGEAPQPGGWRALRLELVGHDRPGIVRDIADALAAGGVNIEAFSSAIASASFSGEALFQATARLRVPDGLATADLRASLERLANEIMVDITVDEAG